MAAAPSSSALTLTAIQAALNAGEILKKGFGTSFEISSKPGRQNFVTAYDKASEAAIINFIREHFPSHCFYAEESGRTGEFHEDKILWVIDPLDGTTNFARHIPIFTISIAAYHRGQVVSGVIFQPLTQELFIAEKGKGAFLNGVRLRVSKTNQIEDALIIAGLPYDDTSFNAINLDKFAQMTRQGVTLRNLGSAALALAYVAAGKADAFWMYNLHYWDIAAGHLLIEEAGGLLEKRGGDSSIYSSSHVLAGNESLFRVLQSQLFGENVQPFSMDGA